MASNVFYANTSIVSIFHSEGDDSPLHDYTNNLSKIYFDSRLEYLNIIGTLNFTVSFDQRNPSGSTIVRGESVRTIYNHSLGYEPIGILVDRSTREVLVGNYFITDSLSKSFRSICLLTDTSNFYIKEKYFVQSATLVKVTKPYTLYICGNSAKTSSA